MFLSSSHLCLLPPLPSSFSLLLLAIPHAEAYPLSSYVNNTWPVRLWMWSENKIPAWAVFLSDHLLGPPHSQCLAGCWEEYWVTVVTVELAAHPGTSKKCKSSDALFVVLSLRPGCKQTSWSSAWFSSHALHLCQCNGPSSLVVFPGWFIVQIQSTFSSVETSAYNKAVHNETLASGCFNEMTIINSHLASLPRKPFQKHDIITGTNESKSPSNW